MSAAAVTQLQSRQPCAMMTRNRTSRKFNAQPSQPDGAQRLSHWTLWLAFPADYARAHLRSAGKGPVFSPELSEIGVVVSPDTPGGGLSARRTRSARLDVAELPDESGSILLTRSASSCHRRSSRHMMRRRPDRPRRTRGT